MDSKIGIRVNLLNRNLVRFFGILIGINDKILMCTTKCKRSQLEFK